MKKIQLQMLAGVFALGLLVGCGDQPTSSMPSEPIKEKPAADAPKAPEAEKADPNMVGGVSSLRDETPKDGEEVAVIETKFGKIVLRFFNDKAPKHVASFKKLAREGFYNGVTFHRVIPGFMIQGGDPNSKDGDKANDGQGGPGYQLEAEFSEVAHVRGILSAARSQDPNSAGSQFFIVHQNGASASGLDTQYTVYGQVVKSGKEKAGEESEFLKVVDKIVNSPRDAQDNPNERIEMKVSIQKWPVK
jgi:peptidyl-prolyl cis-trans isomerase B (cyclophilin B)